MSAPLTTSTPPDASERPPLPPEPGAPAPKPPESFPEDPSLFLEKPPILSQPKPIYHSPKISPSSIPNPSPSVTTTTQVEPGYPSYGGYLYSIPGYSAFQPVSYPGVVQPTQAPIITNEPPNTEFVPYPILPAKETQEENAAELPPEPQPMSNTQSMPPPAIVPMPQKDFELPKPQTDFEDHFTPEIIPATPKPDAVPITECKMNITSLAQGSGATVTIPSPLPSKENKIKPNERFSLKTSIPISKLDLKCVNNSPDSAFQNSLAKKLPSQQFHAQQNKTEENQRPRVEIQSNIVIKTAEEPEVKETRVSPPNNSISTLLNAAEAINKNESQFRKPEPKVDMHNDTKDTTSHTPFTPPITNSLTRPIFNPINVESNKVNFSNKPSDPFSDQKNQIVFIQNKNSTNPKMLLTIQQQNPQVLLQRTNFESKNLQAPSRLSSQSKKCKEELVSDNGTSSKVVALKRMHQENCDENDFENLITENQIYGNKIVVKEKSQGTQQEQDLKNNKVKGDKSTQNETKNVILQPNFVYLSNVQFPTNLMMIKNNAKVAQTTETNNKTNKSTPNENKTELSPPINNLDITTSSTPTKTQNVTVSKEIHVLKSSNNVLQTLSNKTTKNDNIVFQTSNQKVIMNPQIVYQMPVVMNETDKVNQQFVNRSNVSQNKKEFSKPFEQPKSNDKLFIACPYQMDSKSQPKIVITNIRPKIIEEVSSLDIYEKKRRMRRLKYLSNKDFKEQKTDIKKPQEKIEKRNYIITPEKMTAEICKEFANTKVNLDDSNEESDSDYGEDELKQYNAIIKEFEEKTNDDRGKVEFLSGFKLATHESYKDKELDKQDRILRRDRVASAYIAAGRLDWVRKEARKPDPPREDPLLMMADIAGVAELDSVEVLQKKQNFLAQLKLMRVTAKFRESYENAWKVVLSERKRRNCVTFNKPPEKQPRPNVDLDGQLQILTEIKKCVNENNNLIKKRLDSNSTEQDGESIKILAEKNFSELNRLSKMADRSVKIISGQKTRKRDLNPGFDSENIQKQQCINIPTINIPNISKIISLKSNQETSSTGTSTQATSMDEPQSSAAGLQIFGDDDSIKTKDFSCQVEEVRPWPGMEAVMKSFREFDLARRREIHELQRRNTALRVECAHVTVAASRDSDRSRALLAERQHLAGEEISLRKSLRKLCAAVDAIRQS